MNTKRTGSLLSSDLTFWWMLSAFGDVLLQMVQARERGDEREFYRLAQIAGPDAMKKFKFGKPKGRHKKRGATNRANSDRNFGGREFRRLGGVSYGNVAENG